MAPFNEELHLANGSIACMGQIAEQTVTRHHGKIAKSPEFNDFLCKLSKTAPLVVSRVIKKVSRICEAALLAQKESKSSRKRAGPPIRCERNAKHQKRSCAAEEEAAEQGWEDDDEEDLAKKETPRPQPEPQRATEVLSRIPVSEKAGESRSETSEQGDLTRKEMPCPQPESQHSRRVLPYTSASEKEKGGMTETSEQGSLIRQDTPGPRPNPQRSESVHSRTTAPEKEGESKSETSEKQDSVTKPADNAESSAAIELVCGQREGEKPVLPTKYEIEFGLVMGSPKTEAYIKACLVGLKSLTTRSNFNIHEEVAIVWSIIPLLEFFKSRRELHQHLKSRENITGHEVQALTKWNTSEPSEIMDALVKVQRSTIDNKIHRAFGQTKLVESVDAQVTRGFKSVVSGHRSDHLALLEELASKKAGPISKTERDQMIYSYTYEYRAGQKWLEVMDWFGGSGIVMVFVIASESCPFLLSEEAPHLIIFRNQQLQCGDSMDRISENLRTAHCRIAFQCPRIGRSTWSEIP